jgi:hypothetical protein
MTFCNDSETVRRAAKLVEKPARAPAQPARSEPKGESFFDTGEKMTRAD